MIIAANFIKVNRCKTKFRTAILHHSPYVNMQLVILFSLAISYVFSSERRALVSMDSSNLYGKYWSFQYCCFKNNLLWTALIHLFFFFEWQKRRAFQNVHYVSKAVLEVVAIDKILTLSWFSKSPF